MGGELFDAVIERKQFSEQDAASIAAVALRVLQHCHERGVLHRGARGRRHECARCSFLLACTRL